MSPVPSSGEYGRRIPAASGGGVLASVEPDGPAARAGLAVGDTVLTAEGSPLRDVIDWQWLTDGPRVALEAQRASGECHSATLTREVGESWGLTFTETVFDGVKTCRNRCVFCFMTQLPKGLRRALYLRDDDFRLSFLQGNFVTLTNLSDADVGRIVEQHLSPLYVSLHAVDPAVRAELVCASEDRAIERLDELREAGIDIHVQIVLVPGVNDGAVLEQTLTWLAERDGVLSVGIVPLGFTAHQQRFEGSYDAPEAAAAVICNVAPWQIGMRLRDDCTWVYLADEFYLRAGIDVPPAEDYDDFPQYENGIGLVRDFVDGLAAVRDEVTRAVQALPDGVAVTLGTGELFAPMLERELRPLDPEGRVAVVGVRNRYFGGNVGVAGLLTTQDLVRELGGADGGVDPAAGLHLQRRRRAPR